MPQGSIPGPLLFLLYVNNLLSVFLFSSPFSFADDFKLLRSLRSELDVDLLQRDLDCLSDWCSQWKLKLSCPKCVCMRVGHSPAVLPPCSYQLAGEHLSFVSQHRDLGIIVSCDLSWRNHYLHLCKTAYCKPPFH